MTTTATQAVMQRLDSQDQEAERSVTFVLTHDGSERICRTLLLSFSDWQDMGCPDVVTVAVAAGDQLNP